MDKRLEGEVQYYLERYGAVDVARIFGEIDMTIEELERIDYLVDTLELDEIKTYMMENYSDLYSEMIEALEKLGFEYADYEAMVAKYERWKCGAVE